MSKSKLIVVLIIFLFLGAALNQDFKNFSHDLSFEELSRGEMLNQIIEERDYAINEAKKAGVYKCCIHPPCTMCYMEANKWNNFQAGTCACDDLIAQGKEPCPQCKTGLCEVGESASSCDSDNKEVQNENNL